MRSTEEVVEALRVALARVDVVLPSLGVDPVTGASDERFALVELGRCNLRTAQHLTDVLRAMPTGEELRARVRRLNRDSRVP
ncbi:hypothetical protein ACFYZJ_26365 [Streptomyces sp. NPDC001848]|uniref:hypothetical protein n=1 Tax=Streptomyces sp. NPDC001848 TaxID=3364618 RepID=UPI00369F7F13